MRPFKWKLLSSTFHAVQAVSQVLTLVCNQSLLTGAVEERIQMAQLLPTQLELFLTIFVPSGILHFLFSETELKTIRADTENSFGNKLMLNLRPYVNNKLLTSSALEY